MKGLCDRTFPVQGRTQNHTTHQLEKLVLEMSSSERINSLIDMIQIIAYAQEPKDQIQAALRLEQLILEIVRENDKNDSKGEQK